VDGSTAIEYTYAISNAGTAPLIISDVRACCGASHVLAATNVPPAGTTTLTVSLSPEGRSGAIRKSHYLFSNDPVQPCYQLRFIGSIDRASPAAVPPPEVIADPTATGQTATVTIEYFFEHGCRDCLRINREVLPGLSTRYPQCRVAPLDLGDQSNMLALVRYQERLGMSLNAPVSMVVDGRYPLVGADAIVTGLLATVEAALAMPAPLAAADSGAAEILTNRISRFTPGAIIVAGLLDGLNPCAISALIFFVSVLAVARVDRRRVLAVGVSFCAAAFLTYTLLGLGLLGGLRALSGFGALRKGFEATLIAVLGVLAVLSFRDAYRFHKSGNPGAITLQAPDRIKRLVHDRMRRSTRSGGLVAAGFVTGALTTLLESVCTGQVYLPTLALMIRAGGGGARVWSYLLLYNACFTLPLLAVFFAVHRGVRTPQLLDWSRRHVVAAKIGLGILFLTLAAVQILAL